MSFFLPPSWRFKSTFVLGIEVIVGVRLLSWRLSRMPPQVTAYTVVSSCSTASAVMCQWCVSPEEEPWLLNGFTLMTGSDLERLNTERTGSVFWKKLFSVFSSLPPPQPPPEQLELQKHGTQSPEPRPTLSDSSWQLKGVLSQECLSTQRCNSERAVSRWRMRLKYGLKRLLTDACLKSTLAGLTSCRLTFFMHFLFKSNGDNGRNHSDRTA